MSFKRIALFCNIALASVTTYSLCAIDVEYPQIQVGYEVLLKGIGEARTEQQIFSQLKALEGIDVEKLSNPFLLLARLGRMDLIIKLLKRASLPVRMYYSYQLYVLSVKVFHAQCKKGQYISAEEKKEVMENLRLFSQGGDGVLYSEIINNIALAIAFIKILPEDPSSLDNIAVPYRLASVLLKKESGTEKELDVILQRELGVVHSHAATYLILLELVKEYYIKKADQQAFQMIATFLKISEMPMIVRYRMHQVLGEILRRLMDRDKYHEAYYYVDQLLPFLPKLCLPLSVANPLDDAENGLLAQGLLIEWCLTDPYVRILSAMQGVSSEKFEEQIQEKIDGKGFQEWFSQFRDQLEKHGLLRERYESPANPLQAVLANAIYFQALNFMRTKEGQSFCQEDGPRQGKGAQVSIMKKGDVALHVLVESINKMDGQIQQMLDEVKKIEQVQREQQSSLQSIKKNTKSLEGKEGKSLLADYRWLYPPYIWVITSGLFLLLLIVLGLFIYNVRRRRNIKN